MRFFITGAVQSKAGPRQILLFSLVFLFFFIISYALREGLSLGISTESIIRELHQSTEFGKRSLVGVLEDLHIDLLLLSMLLVFLGSLIYHLPFVQKVKTSLFLTLFFLVCAYPLTKVLTYFWKFFAVFTLFFGFVFTLFFLLLIIVLFMFLFLGKGKA